MTVHPIPESSAQEGREDTSPGPSTPTVLLSPLPHLPATPVRDLVSRCLYPLEIQSPIPGEQCSVNREFELGERAQVSKEPVAPLPSPRSAHQARTVECLTRTILFHAPNICSGSVLQMRNLIPNRLSQAHLGSQWPWPQCRGRVQWVWEWCSLTAFSASASSKPPAPPTL